MKRALILIAVVALLVAAAVLFREAGRRTNRAVDEAKMELAGSRAGAELVYAAAFDVSSPPSPPAGVRVVTRPAPVNAVAEYAGVLAFGTDGGLVFDSAYNRVITAVDGLAGTRVSCLLAVKGSLWVGTESGVSLFSGGELKSWRFADPPKNRVNALAADGDRVLIGTQGGLLVRDEGGFRQDPRLIDYPDVMVVSLAAADGVLAAGTWKHGLIVARPDAVFAIGPERGLEGPVTGLAIAGNEIHIGTTLGLYLLESGDRPREAIPGISVADAAVRDNKVLAATLDQGVISLNKRAASTQLPGLRMRGLSEAGGRLYAAADSGLFRLEETGFAEAPVPASPGPLPENRLMSLAVDGAGKLWAGTFTSGVVVLDRGLSPTLLAEPGYSDIDCVRAAGDKVMVGAGRGLLVYSSGRLVRTITDKDGLAGETVFDVLFRPDGSFLAATNKGLTLFQGAQVLSIGVFHGLPNNHVYSLAAWGDKTAAGTLGGLAVLDGLRVVRVHTMDDSPLRHSWVSALAVLDGRLYAGTFGGGVAVFGGDGADPLKGPLDKADVNQNALLVFHGLILAGTYGHGLWVYDPALREWRRPAVKLTSPNITALAAFTDSGGNQVLAAATDAGLNFLDPAAIIK